VLVFLVDFGCPAQRSAVPVGTMRLKALEYGFLSYAAHDILLPVSLTHNLLAIFL